MELSPSGEAISRSAIQEFPNTLWNQKINYLIHKSPPFVPIMRQINPVHMPYPVYLKIYFNNILRPK
jgi:hypothetical protein